MDGFPYGYPLLFRADFTVPLKSTADTVVTLKPLSYATISSTNISQYILQKDPDMLQFGTIRGLIASAIVSIEEAYGFPDIASFVNQLPSEDVSFIYKKLLEVSTLTGVQLQALEDMLDIQFHPAFQEESWDCTICKQKKLDYTRACGFLPKELRDPSPILPHIGRRVFSECPIASIDPFVATQASLVHLFASQNMLPEVGGIGSQSEWFVRVAMLYKRKVNEAEQRAMNTQTDKRK